MGDDLAEEVIIVCTLFSNEIHICLIGKFINIFRNIKHFQILQIAICPGRESLSKQLIEIPCLDSLLYLF